MGLDSVIEAFQKGTEPFSELEFEAVNLLGKAALFICALALFIESSALARLSDAMATI